jgi:hypothetical protein
MLGIKRHKRDLDFFISVWTGLPNVCNRNFAMSLTKELTQIMMASQTINKDGKVDDADKTALLPTNLMVSIK